MTLQKLEKNRLGGAGRSVSHVVQPMNLCGNRRSTLETGALVLLLWLSGSQGAAAQSSDNSAGTLQEIVVTAQHVAENAQTTPIAMSVYGSDELKRNGVASVQDLSAIAQDVNFTDVQGAPVITMRGISSLDTNENGDPAVSVDVDGFYLIRAYSLYASMYDLDRVEILRPARHAQWSQLPRRRHQHHHRAANDA
jgi:iron complex outermembrane receptor protein